MGYGLQDMCPDTFLRNDVIYGVDNSHRRIVFGEIGKIIGFFSQGERESSIQKGNQWPIRNLSEYIMSKYTSCCRNSSSYEMILYINFYVLPISNIQLGELQIKLLNKLQ